MRRAHQEDDHPGNGQQEPEIAQPEAEFRRRAAGDAARAEGHPGVGGVAAELLAQEGADDEPEELQAELLRVEGELGLEQLGHFDGVEDAAEEEDHGVGARGGEDGDVGEERERVVEFVERKGGGIDAPERQVFPLEGRGGLGGHVGADVAGLRAEEEVEDELDGVGLYASLSGGSYVRLVENVCTIAKIQYIHRYPTRCATNPKMNGPVGTPSVTMTVQTPIYLALSRLKNVSATTALPIAIAGQMKNAASARHAAIDA